MKRPPLAIDDAAAARPPKKLRAAPAPKKSRTVQAPKKNPAATAPRAPPFSGLDAYEELGKIGKGGFGVVFKARHLATGEIVAVKALREGKHGVADRRAFLWEASCLAACRGHPSLVDLRDVAREVDTGDVFLVMEYVGPSLHHVMQHERRGRPFLEAEVRRLMRQLLSGSHKMHRKGLIHRDLKPENILVKDNGDLKICDLGLAVTAAWPDQHVAGTLWYMAPEMLLGKRDYDGLVDSWSLGCVMAELLTGEALFQGTSSEDHLFEVFRLLGVQPDHKTWCPEEGESRLSRYEEMFGVDNYLHDIFPEEGAFGQSPLSPAGFEVLNGLLTCNPDKRLTAGAALRRPWFAEPDSPAVRSSESVLIVV